ncbi:MAG: MFS transporter [Gammaproteobacteria bacterium]|nr:MFS transporter [Gammaproteobacteria bacterium]MYE28184.1 MFS transporter [Gammaproteobacteria bacterium]MYI01625.1 MFS transporter [Gammaproteobacteria bacterium]
MNDMTRRRTYPWFIAVFACIVLMVSNGQTISGLSVFDVAFIEEFGWSLGEIKFRDMITLLLAGLFAPFIGILIDRLGVRRCMLVGWVLLILGNIAYSRLESLTGLYLVHALFALVLVVCGLNAAVILVSKWFVRYRGTAIGIALMGTSMGGIVFPQYGTAMIEALDWRSAFAWGSLFPAVMLVATWLLVKDKPELPEQAGADAAPDTGMAYADALRSRSFWALAIIAMSTFYTVLGTQAHIFVYMTDADFSAQVATNAISLFFFCALIGKFVFGLAADHFDKRKVFYGNILVMLLGSLILIRMDVALIWVAVTAFGLGWGGVYTLLQLTVMNIFGTRDAGKILGTITVLDASGGGLGIWLTGVIYDTTGSYELPFLIFAALILVALAALTQVRQPEPGSVAAAGATT